MSDPATAWPAARPTGIEPIQHPAWEDVRNGVLDLAAEGPVTVVIIGEPGTGKTWLLQELASSLAEHGFPTMMLMRGDLPMAVSPGAALLVDEAGLMSDAARADLTEQQHGVVVLAAQDWPGSDGKAGPVVLELRSLHPDELPLFASRWLRRAGLPAATIDTNVLQRQAAESGYAVRTVVQLLRAAAATNAVLPTQPEPARVEPVAAELDDALPIEPMPLPMQPRRRAFVRPALVISAIAAAIVLGWALLPTPPAQLAQDTPATPDSAPPTLADATPAAPSLPQGEITNPATPPIVADAAPPPQRQAEATTPAVPAEPASPVVPPVRQAEVAEPASEPVTAEATPPLRQADPVSPPVVAEAPAPAPPVHEAETVNPASEPVAAQTAPSTPPAMPPLRQAEIVTPTTPPPVVAEATPAPVVLPPLHDAAVPDPALVTAAAPPPLAAPLTPPEAGPVTALPELSASTTAPATASALPPPALAKPQPAVEATLAPPLAIPAPAAPRGGPGLVLVAQRGDTLQSLYGSVYRDRNAPAYAAVKAANPGPFKPGAILIFPEPPGGWQRVQR